jgi:hypothetical protein
MRPWLYPALIVVALAGDAAAQTQQPIGPAPTPGPGLALPPLGGPGSGTGTGTGGAGNRALGGSIGGVPGLHRVPGPASSGVLMPGNAPGLSNGTPR